EKMYLVSESYYPKEEHFEEVLNILKETSEMIKEQDGALMSFSLKPEQKNGPITGISLWSSREKFTNFMKSEHAEKIMKSGLSAKVKSWTTDIKANLYTVEQAWHAAS
ncbi:antibiotic biosynthesis monooxygenase, partial [Arthrospira platensis SPKY1]|nr:antibiotic biosynthesis monooxygenase [Arthrospira platensis SPKY1]